MEIETEHKFGSTLLGRLSSWKLLATGYCGLLNRFPAFLDTIVKLEIYRTS